MNGDEGSQQRTRRRRRGAQHTIWRQESRTKNTAATFGVGEDDRHEPGAEVGDFDGEIPLPELVHADHLPRAGGGRRVRVGRRDEEAAQQREEQLAPRH